MIKEIQSALVQHFKTARTASADPNYPAAIKPYEQEILRPRNLNNLPLLCVDVSNDFTLEAQDTTGAFQAGTYVPQIILFDQNFTAPDSEHTTLAALVDWVLDAIRGEILTIAGQPVTISEQVTGKIVTDFEVPFAQLSITINTSEE